MNPVSIDGLGLGLNLHTRSKSAGQGMQSGNWKWHLDKVFVKINGERHYLWHAVDHDSRMMFRLMSYFPLKNLSGICIWHKPPEFKVRIN